MKENGESKKGDHVVAFLIDALAGLKTGSGQWLCCCKPGSCLRLSYFFSLRSFRTLGDFELDFLALFESLEAVTLNGAVVNEDI